MKYFLVLLLLISSIFISIAGAETKLVTCNRVQNNPSSNHILIYIVLIINDKNVTSLQTRLYNYRMRNLISTKLPAQDIPGFTLYAVQGIAPSLEVDNQIFNGKSGFVRMGEIDFSCL